MNCKHCNKPIILIPSAKERAEKYGGKPSDYTRLFTIHTDCQLELNRQSLSELIQRRKLEVPPLFN